MNKASRSALAAPLVAAIAASSAFMAAGHAAETRSVWDGLYTTIQADRGQQLIAEQCSLCHGNEMRGASGVPPTVGPDFLLKWENKTVSELFVYLKTTMPPSAPGSLNDQRYADVIAALFRLNGFPSGESAEISPDPVLLTDTVITKDRPSP